MPDPIPVDDLSDPRLADYAGLREAERAPDGLEKRRGVFMAEGELVARHLFNSNITVRSILLTPPRLATLGQVIPPGIPVYVAPQSLMNALVGFNMHRGVLACGVRPPDTDADAVLRHAQTLVILEGLCNLDNVGGVFRSAGALCRRPGVLLDPTCCDPLYRKAIRVSMGRTLMIPFARGAPWPGVLARVREAGFTIVAFTPRANAVPIDRIDPAAHARLALMIGTEGEGLSPGAAAAADIAVRIPIAPGVDSLNAHVAASIALHRLGRLGEPGAPEPG
ncbi:MAG: TrmH family RNA methyltransferase [Phycisphaerales bacterium]